MKETLKQQPMKAPTITSAICVTLCSLILIHEGFADPIVRFDPFGFNYEAGNPGSTRGWEFDVLSSGGITVTHLGIFDGGADGLASSHAIGIWNSSGSLLVSGTIPAGTGAPLDSNGLFRLIDTPDISLPQGTGYRIGAYYGTFPIPSDGDPFDTAVSNLNVDPSISFIRSRAAISVATLAYPTQTFSFQDPGYFGPGFQIVPEPCSLSLIIFAMALWIRRRRRA